MFILFGKKGHSFSMKKIGCPYRIKNKKSGQCIIDLFSEDRYCSIHGEELGGMRQAVGLGALVEERLAIKTRVHSMYYMDYVLGTTLFFVLCGVALSQSLF